VLQAKQGLVDAVKHGLGANTEQLRKVGGWGGASSSGHGVFYTKGSCRSCSSTGNVSMPRLLNALLPAQHPTAPPLLQLRRRAGIPTDAASDETYAAFGAALKEHEARLQVQYAGGCPPGFPVLRSLGRLLSYAA
jgi:hypothetical protein